jgi:glutamine amidotransferase
MPRALEPVRGVLVAPAPVARWGLGYAQGGEILLSRSPRLHTENVDFFAAFQNLRSDCVIAHACPPDEFSGNSNTQPFRYRQWMFAQEGCAPSAPAVQAAVFEHIPDFLQRNIHGRTIDEQIFHLFLGHLHRVGSLDEANLSPERTCALISEALGTFRTAVSGTGVAVEPGNLMVSNGRSFVAIRLAQPLYLRRLNIPSPRSSRDDSFRGVLVVSASSSPGEGFEEIPVHTALRVSRDVHTDIAPLAL